MIKTIVLKSNYTKLITTTLLAFALLVGGFFLTSYSVFAETPEVTTNTATNITDSNATLNAMNGDAPATGHSFWISTTPEIDTSTPNNIPVGVYSTPDMGSIDADTAFDAQLSIITTDGIPGNITEITPNTPYYYVAWTFTDEWHPGEELSFTTNPPDTTGSQFMYDPEYLSANSSEDDAVHVMVPAGVTDVRFSYTDGTTIYPGPGYEHFQGSQFPTPSGKHQYRGKASLPLGTYTATGEFEIAGEWYPIEGSATVYALGQPTGSFIIPSETNSTFRPTDNPARIKTNDQDNSFADIKFTIDSETDYIVNRDKCDLREAGNYVFCDIDTSDTWMKDLSDGSHTVSAIIYNKARNHTAILSKSFVIDSTRPDVTNFAISPEEPPYTTSITASADVTADSGVKDVVFYITEPREDGVCTGNGPYITQVTANLVSGISYTGTLDTSALTGDYCVNVIAENMAAGHSAIQKKKVVIDNTPAGPSLTITAPTAYETVAGEYTFTADYQNGPTNSISWAIRKYSLTCSAANDANVVGNVDGHHDTLAFDTPTLSATFDTSEWTNGEYCFVVNPTNVAGLRTVQNFTVDNSTSTEDSTETGDGEESTPPTSPTPTSFTGGLTSSGSISSGGGTSSSVGGEVLGAETFFFTQYLKLGSRDGDVPELQKYLNEHGQNSGIVDGIFGLITQKAVISFQKLNGLIGDGIVGPLTRAVLNK